MTDEPYTQAVDFVLEKVVHYARMSPQKLTGYLPSIGFNDLTDARGHLRPVGPEALDALRGASERAVEASPFAGRVDFSRVFDSVKRNFGATFLRADFKYYSEDELAGLFANWVAIAAEDCGSRVHILPCDLGLDGVDRLQLGPLTLHRRKAIWSSLEAELAVFEAADPVDAVYKDHRARQVEAARTHFEGYPDVVEVVVNDCDGPTSRAVAEQTLQVFLDYIHVIAGESHTKRMRGAGPAAAIDRRSYLVRLETGLWVSQSLKWSGANIGDEAWKGFSEELASGCQAPIVGVLDAISARRPLPLLGDRFVDACAWYGDAARDPSPAAAAVKYVTVMERLLWTNEGQGQGTISGRISRRLAALTFDTKTWNYEAIREEVRDAYRLRSGLLHGEIAKSDPEVMLRLRRCEKHARELLLAWLDRFGNGFAEEVSLDALRAHLKGFVAEVEEETKSRLGTK